MNQKSSDEVLHDILDLHARMTRVEWAETRWRFFIVLLGYVIRQPNQKNIRNAAQLFAVMARRDWWPCMPSVALGIGAMAAGMGAMARDYPVSLVVVSGCLAVAAILTRPHKN